MKNLQLTGWIACALLLSVSCRKENAVSLAATSSLITEAKTYFDKHVDNPGQTPMKGSAAAITSRTVLWRDALVGSDGNTVIVPLQYSLPQFLSLNDGSRNLYSISNFSKLVLTKDSTGIFTDVVQIRIPDSAYRSNPTTSFTGIVFQESWNGNPLPTLKVVPENEFNTHAAGRVITVCNTISGYNYAPSAPGDGYNWSRTTCTSMNIPDTRDAGSGSSSGGSGGNGGSGSSGGSVGSSRPSSTIAVYSPKNLIPSLPNYLQCFNLSATATYSIQICVDQPKAGERTPWGFSTMEVLNGNNPFNVGHTFLVLTEHDGLKTIVRNVGFYPGTSIFPNSPSVQGVYNNDETHAYNISGSFSVTGQNFMNLISFMLVNNGCMYNLSSNNCTSWALNALDQAHIYLPRNLGSWLGGMGNDPGDLGEDIRNGNVPGMTKNTSDNLHMNYGSCN